MNRLSIILLLVLGSAFNHANANVRLPAIFSNGMVLQQNQSVNCWGWADAGEKISITPSWSGKKYVTVADANGKWNVSIPAGAAGGPFNIVFQGKNMVKLEDVLLGEVWICSGQSNMGFTLKTDLHSKETVAAANYPTIRYFSVARQYGPNTFEDAPGSVWKATTPKTAPSFSAVAFYFAKKLEEELHVPVGLVFSAWGGTPAEAWTPRETLSTDTMLTHYFERWKLIQESVGADSAKYFKELEAWQQDSTHLKKPAEPQTYYYYKRPWREPAVLFNGMINPVIPFTVKGVLWYQGESNVGFPTEYYNLFSKMISVWRERWKQPTMPFYFVQIAPYGYNNLEAAAELRDGQYQVMKDIPYTGMAVATDLGNMDDIHFTDKQPVGERLARIALAKDYKLSKMTYKGPEILKITRDNEKLIAHFNAGTSLTIQPGRGNTVKGFEVGYREPGATGIIYIPATGTIDGKKVMISLNLPPNATATVLRYAWILTGEANLLDAEGLPAFPFSIKIDQ